MTFKFKLFLGILLVLSGWLGFNTTAVLAQEEVSTRSLTFRNGETELTGTLYLPEGAGPFPAVVIMHGAGPETRQPYLPDAKMLAANGIAALIFDKRGTGASSGDWQRSSLDDLMADGLAALAQVQQEPEINPAQVGILGSSQGAWLAPFMAARSEGVAFFVQVTSAATPLANQEMWDDALSLQAQGFSARAIAMEMKALHLLYSSRSLIQRGILPLGDLWFVHYDPYLDPAMAWDEVSVPALVLFGAQDRTVPTESSLEIVKNALAQNGDQTSRVVVFPDKGHALNGRSRNQDGTYVALVSDWIKAVTQGEPLPPIPYSDAYNPPNDLRWYGVGEDSTRWYAMVSFQLPLILIFLLTFILAIIVSLLPWINVGSVQSRLALGLTGAVNLFLLSDLLFVLNFLLNADAESYTPPVPLGNWLFPLAWVSVVLAVGLVYFGRQVWRENGRFGRVVFGLVTITAWGFILFLAYWGILGGRLS